MSDNNDWQLKNKDWVRLRKQQWREVKYNIDKYSEGWLNIDKAQQKDVEKYFLTGDKKALKSLYEMFDSLLIELWIYPSTDIVRLKEVFERHIKEKAKYSELTAYHTTERNTFTGLTVYRPVIIQGAPSNEQYRGGSPLNGRDILIDKVFMPQTLAEGLALEEGEGKDVYAIDEFLGFSGCFEAFFNRSENLAHDVCPYKVAFWRDALLLSFNAETEVLGVIKDRGEFEWLIVALDIVNANLDNYDPRQVKLAQEITQVLNEPEVFNMVKEKLAEIRAKH